MIGIKIVYNVKITYISADVKLNLVEFSRFYIVHNVILTINVPLIWKVREIIFF